jgi:hypothetical protein
MRAAMRTATLGTCRQGEQRQHNRDRSQTLHAVILRLFEMAGAGFGTDAEAARVEEG